MLSAPAPSNRLGDSSEYESEFRSGGGGGDETKKKRQVNLADLRVCGPMFPFYFAAGFLFLVC